MSPQPNAKNHVAEILRPLLAEHLGRLRARYLWHGLAAIAALTLGLVALFFTLDYTLRLPAAVRLFHTAAIVAALAYGVVRFVRYPLTRAFSDLDLALWLEHGHPELHERLVSAVQLDAGDDRSLRNQSRAMIERLHAETATAVQQLDPSALFDDRRTVRGGIGAMLLAAMLVIGALLAPTTAHAFLLRQLGLGVDYPRETTLIFELPTTSADLQRIDHEGVTELLLPAGGDLIVSVHATGRVPKEVFLHVEPLRGTALRGADPTADAPARKVPLTPRPGDRFRHVFRRLTGSFELHASGGDDEHGDRRVVVRTVHPAQVATITATITPPAYTGAGTMTQTGGAIEALVGSQVECAVVTTGPVRQATMVFLEQARRLDLVPTHLADDSGAATEFRGSFAIEASDRYQVELLTDDGLRNPNPGTYPLAALQDYAPVGRWLLPEDEGLALLPTALLVLRVDARDDFGLRTIDLTIERDGQPTLVQPLWQPPASAASTQAMPTAFFEVGDLLQGSRLGAQQPGDGGAIAGGNLGGGGLVLMSTLRDNKEPEVGQAELPRRIVQIVDGPQLAALVARTFRGLREDVAQALEVQADRRLRLDELAARPDRTPAETSQMLTAVEVGQGRVAGTLTRAHRTLMRAFDQHLWNRLEPSQHAQAVVTLYRRRSAELQEPLALDPGFYREVAALRAAGTIGAMETTLDPMLQMVQLADRATTDLAPRAARLLAEAHVAGDRADETKRIQEASATMQAIETTLRDLLLRLEEWNDYQDLVQEVRALRDRQRDLQSRTQDVRGK
jgi:hypothetical protein